MMRAFFFFVDANFTNLLRIYTNTNLHESWELAEGFRL